MAWIVVPKTYLVTRGKCDVVMAMDSVEMLMFSLDMYCVLVEGEITRIVFGLVDYFEINRITESQ